jgi:hypothetical protein
MRRGQRTRAARWRIALCWLFRHRIRTTLSAEKKTYIFNLAANDCALLLAIPLASVSATS